MSLPICSKKLGCNVCPEKSGCIAFKNREYCEMRDQCSNCAFCDSCSTFLRQNLAEDISQKESVDHPQHYNSGKIECIDALKELAGSDEYRGFLRLNAVKYLWRMGHKGSAVEDLKKARWYIDRLVSELESDN